MTILKYCKDGKQVEDAHSAAGRAVARDENMVGGRRGDAGCIAPG